MQTVDSHKIQEKILELLHSLNGKISDLDILWDKFPNEDYDMDIYPSLIKLEFLHKIQIIRKEDGGIISIQLL